MSKITKNKLALLAMASLGMVTSGSALAAGMVVDSKGGLEVFELDESNYWFKLGGRLFFDQVFFDADQNSNSSFPSGSQIRSARLMFKGGVGNHWVYKLDVDFKDAPNVGGGSRFGEVFLGYDGCKNLWLALGQISVPFGLENWASATETPFMEISLPSSAFSPSLGLGVYAELHADLFTAAAALYHPPAGTRQMGDILSVPPDVPGSGPQGSNPGSDTLGIGGRVTFSPMHDEYTVYHAGISSRYEKLHELANFFDYNTGLETRTRQSPDLLTNIPFFSVKSHDVWGFELAGRWGPFILQGEYMLANVHRDSTYPVDDMRNPGGNFHYHGYYALASYVLTGETKQYDFNSGTFGRVIPKSRKGAWEILLRHSYVDLNNNNLSTQLPLNAPFAFVSFIPTAGINVNDIVGSAHSTSVGLTWWMNENIRFMANYVRTDLSNSTDVDSLGLRAQVSW